MNKTKHNRAMFSNTAQHLLAKLAEDLFSTRQAPMNKRWILVPNTEIGHWIRKELVKATSHHIAMGLEIFTSIDALIKHLFLQAHQSNPRIPDHITLPLFIHEILNRQPGPSSLPWASAKPSYATTKKLALLFKKFYAFSESPSKEHVFYRELFEQINAHFTPLPEVFLSLLQKFPNFRASLHIFGYAHLPRHIADFFVNISHHFPVYFYCFSPTQEYFGDLLSDRTIDFLLKQMPHQEAYELYSLADRQPLLANLTHKSQATQNFFLDKDIPYIEAFALPIPKTALSTLKKEIFELQPCSTAQQDSSLKILKASNLFREVQTVFTEISSLLHQGISAEEIFILSTHIETYIPSLHAVFQPHIPLYFSKAQAPQAKALEEKLLLITALLHSQGNLYHLLRFLSHPDRSARINTADLPMVTQSLTKAWNQLSKRAHPFSDLASQLLQDYPFTEGSLECWEIIIPILQELQEFLLSPFEATCEYHFLHLFSFLEKAFVLSVEELSFIMALRHLLDPDFWKKSYSLHFFTDFCLDFLSHFYGNSPLYHKPGPFVGSLHDLSLIPKGHTFILGANKRTSSVELIELADSQSAEEFLFSSSEDEENFHFLQSLMSTEHSLHISYLSSADQPSLPSTYLQYLQQILSLPEERVPSRSYAATHFIEKRTVHVAQAHHYTLAKAFLSPKRYKPSLFRVDSQCPDFLSLSVKELVYTLTHPLSSFLHARYNTYLRSPEALVSQERVFPSRSYAQKRWIEQLQGCPQQTTNYLSAFSEQLFADCDHSICEIISSLKSLPNQEPFSVIFSSKLFHKAGPLDHLLPPYPLVYKEKLFHIETTIEGVCEAGLYLFSMDPSATVKKTERNSKGVPRDLLALQNYLTAYIHVALLRETFLPDAGLYSVTLPFELEPLPLPFSKAQAYLSQVMHTYQMVLKEPIPLISQECWSLLDQPEKLRSTITSEINAKRNDPNSELFWLLHNRDNDLSLNETARLAFLSLFKG